MPVKWPYIVFLILFIGVSFYLFYPKIENFFVFFPESKFPLTPGEQHLNHKEVYFHTEDGKKLHGWFFPLREELPVILFCHGNAGNISHRLDNVRLLLEKNLQVFIFDYRGYGKSSGRPSEKGLYMDGLAAHDYLVEKEHLASSDIIPFGRSLGAAVAIEVALRKKVRSVIIESAFTSTKDMAKTMFLFALLSPFLPANYNNLEKISRLNVPKLIIHGEEDEIVPFSMGQRLFDTSGAPKFFFRIKGAGHNDTYLIGGEKYFQTIATFVKDSKIIAQPQRH
ncbi:MAG: alpha/beta hydrolase [Deltaproteobacteria bacterium]|nr:alpha/beta hydrolase [Deltaproteobacteria bacterium]